MQAPYARECLKSPTNYDAPPAESIFPTHSNESGQITVFLSLLFLVLIGFSLCVVEGVEDYSVSYLAEDAVKSAGDDILANYDKELFNNYHIFFLDPREKNYMLTDGKQSIRQYFSGNSIPQIQCTSMEIIEEKTALDEEGLYLKHEIREWMKYREERKIEENVRKLLKSVVESSEERQQCANGVKEAEREEKEETEKKSQNEEETETEEERRQGREADTAEEGRQGETETAEGSQYEEEGEEQQQESSSTEALDPEVQRVRATWKEIKESLQLLIKTGALFYAAENPSALSKQSISSDNLPSKAKGFSSSEKTELGDKLKDFSFLDMKKVMRLFSEDISIDTGSSLWTKESYLLSYIEDNFSHYGRADKEKTGKSSEKQQKQNDKKNSKVQALLYETEYLIGGKNSDLENLKNVTNSILALRFITNYIYTGKDAEISAEVNTMAAAVTGVMGMPQATKAVQVLIRTAISYGESLLELHTLLSGGKISLTKSKATWNLELKTMVKQLKEKATVKEGKQSVSYTDFLRMLLLMKGESKRLCYRMMDIMQENTACTEEGFLMENCLFSYKWKVGLSAGKIQINLIRQNSY